MWIFWFWNPSQGHTHKQKNVTQLNAIHRQVVEKNNVKCETHKMTHCHSTWVTNVSTMRTVSTPSTNSLHTRYIRQAKRRRVTNRPFRWTFNGGLNPESLAARNQVTDSKVARPREPSHKQSTSGTGAVGIETPLSVSAA